MCNAPASINRMNATKPTAAEEKGLDRKVDDAKTASLEALREREAARKTDPATKDSTPA